MSLILVILCTQCAWVNETSLLERKEERNEGRRKKLPWSFYSICISLFSLKLLNLIDFRRFFSTTGILILWISHILKIFKIDWVTLFLFAFILNRSLGSTSQINLIYFHREARCEKDRVRTFITKEVLELFYLQLYQMIGKDML